MMFRAFSVLFPIFFTFCVTSHFASIYSIRSWFILILSCFSHRYKIYLLCQSRYLLSELQVQWQERRFKITKERERKSILFQYCIFNRRQRPNFLNFLSNPFKLFLWKSGSRVTGVVLKQRTNILLGLEEKTKD